MTRMDRQTMIKMAGIGGAAVFVGGKYLGEPSEAVAMNSRFDAVLRLTASGMVIATGPTGFTVDEARARIFALVAQGARVQWGTTAWTKAGAWWVILNGPQLRPGPADAYGVAYVENKDGTYEWYPWEVSGTLR